MTKTTVYNATGGIVAKWDGGAACAGLSGGGDPANTILGALMYGGHMVVEADEGVFVYSMRCELLPKWARIATPDDTQAAQDESNHNEGAADDRD